VGRFLRGTVGRWDTSLSGKMQDRQTLCCKIDNNTINTSYDVRILLTYGGRKPHFLRARARGPKVPLLSLIFAIEKKEEGDSVPREVSASVESVL
jgi:hypothetical protein